MLLLRNSVVLATENKLKKADKLMLTWNDLFSKQSSLINTKREAIKLSARFRFIKRATTIAI
jgi:hypothetical protein